MKASAREDGRDRLARWRAVSDTVTPDLVVLAGLSVLVLVGAGVLDEVVLLAVGAMLSLAGYLYSRRSG